MALELGDRAPSFALEGTHNGVRRTHSIEEHRGRPVMLVFYPGDNTPICTRQLNAYTADVDQFRDLGLQILALSPQGLDSHEEFALDQGGFAFPLLADEDKAVAQAYGVLGPMGFYRRCIFIIDGEGTLVYVRRGHAASTFRTTDELIRAVCEATLT